MLHSALSVAAIFWIAAAAAEPLMFDIAQAELAYDQRTGEPLVSFRFTPDSARKFAQLTQQNVGHVIEMRVDGKVLSRPILQNSGQISGPLNAQEARDLAARLLSGTQLEIEAMAN
jgi:preprotein translocase subunit SecD